MLPNHDLFVKRSGWLLYLDSEGVFQVTLRRFKVQDGKAPGRGTDSAEVLRGKDIGAFKKQRGSLGGRGGLLLSES